MSRRLELRLGDIEEAIGNIRSMMKGRDQGDLAADPFLRAAYERFIEIISEASRHIPAELKQAHGDIPWRAIADTGNILRHVYHSIHGETLWAIYEKDLEPLERAMQSMKAVLIAKSSK